MTGILFGLAGALFIGSSDCIARVTAQRVTLTVLICCVMGLSFFLLTTVLALTDNFPPWHLHAWLASAVSGFLNVVALYFLYLALANGPVVVASPAASSFTVILVMLNVFAGQPWSLMQLVAVVIVFAGVVMLTKNNDNDDAAQYPAAHLRKTVLLATAAAVTVSVRMFLAQDATDQLGALHALYLNRLFALLTISTWLLWQLTQRVPLQMPSGRTTGLVVMQSLLEMAAFSAFLFGSLLGSRVAATIGFSAFAAATVIIAKVFLGETIGRYRGFWITVIVVGVLLAAVGTPS